MREDLDKRRMKTGLRREEVGKERIGSEQHCLGLNTGGVREKGRKQEHHKGKPNMEYCSN